MNHAYYKLWNNRNNSKVEFILDAHMLHEGYKTFIKKVEDAVRELGEDSYSDIKIIVDVLSNYTDMTIDKIKEILPKPMYEYWMECTDLEKMERVLKETKWMLDYRKELSLTDDLANIYYAEVELLQKRMANIPSSENSNINPQTNIPMNLEDYVITICFDNGFEPYFKVTKKGEPHKCNDEELRIISKKLDIIRRRIDSCHRRP